MARWFRIWEKKRGPRRTVPRMVASAGEIFFFSAMFFFGAIFMAMTIASNWLQTWPIRSMFPEVAYVKTEGIIQETRVRRVEKNDRVRYYPEALVLVEIDGDISRKWTLRRNSVIYNQEEAAWQRIEGYQPGWIYDAWYDPATPSRTTILERSSAYGLWVIYLVLISLVVIGGIGLIYTLLLMGISIERRASLAGKAKSLKLLRESMPADHYPAIPNDANLTNSPGVRLAYRLPIEVSPGWWLLATFVFSLLWSGMAGVFFVVALAKHLDGNPDWMLTIVCVPTIAVALTALHRFLREVTNHTHVGPTGVEISNHPLYPGREYRVFVTQAGMMKVKKLRVSLVCEESATYVQGTDVRTERHRVLEDDVATFSNFEIRPGMPFEADYQLKIPNASMHSFKSEHNAIHWKLIVRISTHSTKAVDRSFPIVVYPDGEGAT